MTKECACGLAAMNMNMRIDAIANIIKDAETHNRPLSPGEIGIIDEHARLVLKEDMPQIKKFCKADIDMEIDAMNVVNKKIHNINKPKDRDIIQHNIIASLEGVRDMMGVCKKE